MASRRKSPNSVIQENSSTHHLLVDQTSKMMFAGLIHQQTSFSPHHAGVPGSRIISASGLIWTILFWTWRKHLTVVLILMWYVFVKIWCQTSRFSYLTSFLSDTESKKKFLDPDQVQVYHSAANWEVRKKRKPKKWPEHFQNSRSCGVEVGLLLISYYHQCCDCND